MSGQTTMKALAEVLAALAELPQSAADYVLEEAKRIKQEALVCEYGEGAQHSELFQAVEVLNRRYTRNGARRLILAAYYLERNG